MLDYILYWSLFMGTEAMAHRLSGGEAPWRAIWSNTNDNKHEITTCIKADATIEPGSERMPMTIRDFVDDHSRICQGIIIRIHMSFLLRVTFDALSLTDIVREYCTKSYHAYRLVPHLSYNFIDIEKQLKSLKWSYEVGMEMVTAWGRDGQGHRGPKGERLKEYLKLKGTGKHAKAAARSLGCVFAFLY